jgi:YidC/Oxa1 family membrane protein insertase
MDKRAILFLILSVVILYLFSYYEYQQEKSGLERITSEPAAPPATTPAPPPAIIKETREEGMGQGELQVRDVVVETDLYRAILSSRGGVIRHWELNQYKESPEPESPHIVLFSAEDKEPPIYPLAISIEGATDQVRERFLHGLYQVEGEDLNLKGPGRKGRISFLAKDDSTGQVLMKQLTFYSDRYDIELKVATEGFQQDYTVYLGANFAILGGEKTTTYMSFIGPTSLIDGNLVKLSPSDIETEAIHPGKLSWTGLQDKYFMAALIPKEGTGTMVARKFADEEVTVGIRSAPATGPQTNAYQLYAGPKEYDRLRAYRLKLEETIDFGWFMYGSWSLVRAIAQPLFSVLRFFHDLTNNYGLAIILLTTSIKLVFVPLTHKSYISMKGMQELQPKVAALQKKYKSDRQKLQQELMDLYRKNKVNPIGGCLPMVLQIPVFISLFNIFYTTIELRQAPFIFWIKDLSDKDPYYILPIIMGASMILQQKLQPTTMDPRQAKMLLFLPVVFTYFFLWFPSGLVLYWLVNNCLSILQQYITIRYSKSAKLKPVKS